MNASKRGSKDSTPMPTPKPVPATDAPEAPVLHDLDDGEAGWQGSRDEQFTDAAGNPGPAVATPGEDAPAPQGSPVLLASIAIYREPDGRLSLVREHVPQAFFTVGKDLFEEVKADLHARLAAFDAE
jgi:hypothetical protein